MKVRFALSVASLLIVFSLLITAQEQTDASAISESTCKIFSVGGQTLEFCGTKEKIQQNIREALRVEQNVENQVPPDASKKETLDASPSPQKVKAQVPGAPAQPGGTLPYIIDRVKNVRQEEDESEGTIEEATYTIETAAAGDTYFAVTINTAQIDRDVAHLTKDMGTVTHQWLSALPLVKSTYEERVGWANTKVRIHHDGDQLGWQFTRPTVINDIVRSGGEVMITLLGVPDDLAKYCARYEGNTCADWVNRGPPNDLERYKDYIRTVVQHYNDLGVREFIIWNEPNNDFDFWQGGYTSPSAPYEEPTAEDFTEVVIATAQAIRDVDPTLQIGGVGSSAFAGHMTSETGVEVYIPEFLLPALAAEGIYLSDYHFHSYNPHPRSGGEIPSGIERIRNEYSPSIQFNLDEYNQRTSPDFNDHRHAAWLATFVDTMIDRGIDDMGYFQIFSTVYSGGTHKTSSFLGIDMNYIDETGVVKPSLLFRQLLREAPGSLLVHDDLDATGTVSVFTLTDGQDYCVYVANFDESGRTAHVDLIGTGGGGFAGKDYLYTRKVIDATHGNPFAVESRIEQVLGPLWEATVGQGSSVAVYQQQAEPEIRMVNNWPELNPWIAYEQQVTVHGKVRTEILLDPYTVQQVCFRYGGTAAAQSGQGGESLLNPVVRALDAPLSIIKGTDDVISQYLNTLKDAVVQAFTGRKR